MSLLEATSSVQNSVMVTWYHPLLIRSKEIDLEKRKRNYNFAVKSGVSLRHAMQCALNSRNGMFYLRVRLVGVPPAKPRELP
jgi:hypothetical protein